MQKAKDPQGMLNVIMSLETQLVKAQAAEDIFASS